MSPATTLSDNSRGILFMLATVTGFAFGDTFVKLASADLSIAQIIIIRSLIALPVVTFVAWHQSAFASTRRMAERFIALRAIGEVGATAIYLTALVHLDIANATAILQIVPLATTAIAALLLGEPVGVRRWVAIGIGFLAVLLIVRPGMEGFNSWSLLALASVGFIVLRDISSRLLPATTHPLAVSMLSILVMIPLGFVMLPFQSWEPLTQRAIVYCGVSGIFLSAAFVSITLAMRHGEVAVVAPFRYAILLWAVVLQIAVFGVWPDSLTLIGSALLVATGLYSLYRERKVQGGSSATLASVSTTAVPPPT
jgi:drug/metabolite transporter (DMT)-like permease